MAARAARPGRRPSGNAAGVGRRWLVLAFLAAAAGAVWWLAAADGDGSAGEGPAAAADEVLQLATRVVASYPHDPEASTQGLLWFEERLYESTGMWGRSSLRRVDLETGGVERLVPLDAALFGEGLARVGRELVQLTWQSGRALRWDVDSMTQIGEHGYGGEGWGLCFDGDVLWRSDGTSRLARHLPGDFGFVDSIEVLVDGKPVERLNELECAEGWVYANVWQTDDIVRIDPTSGTVVAVIDTSGLLSAAERASAGVANGIAYRPATGTFLVTGKSWPRLFEVAFVAAEVSRQAPRP